MADQSISNETIEEIRKRHEEDDGQNWVLLTHEKLKGMFIHCYKDRATLLAIVDELESKVVRYQGLIQLYRETTE